MTHPTQALVQSSYKTSLYNTPNPHVGPLSSTDTSHSHSASDRWSQARTCSLLTVPHSSVSLLPQRPVPIQLTSSNVVAIPTRLPLPNALRLATPPKVLKVSLRRIAPPLQQPTIHAIAHTPHTIPNICRPRRPDTPLKRPPMIHHHLIPHLCTPPGDSHTPS